MLENNKKKINGNTLTNNIPISDNNNLIIWKDVNKNISLEESIRSKSEDLNNDTQTKFRYIY